MKNNSNLFFKKPELYFQPFDSTISRELKNNNLSDDYLNITKELSNFFYYQTIKNKDYVNPYYNEPDLESKKRFYENLWDKEIPGDSPLKKAVNVVYFLKKQKQEENKNNFQFEMSPENEKDEDGDEFIHVNVHKAIEKIPKDFDNPQISKLLDKRNIYDFDQKIELIEKISLVDKFGKQFSIKKSTQREYVHNSRKKYPMRINEFSDIAYSQVYQKILPGYNAKLLSKDLIIEKPVRYEEQKQKIIILVDFSGSMGETIKQNWVLAILANRLKYVMKKECEIFFSYFLTVEDMSYFKWYHAYDENTALELFEKIDTNPNGGDTEIGRVINKIDEVIKNEQNFFNLNIIFKKEKPEILVINDGQDTVKTFVEYKTNAITLYEHNEELKQLCEKTGGKYINID